MQEAKLSLEAALFMSPTSLELEEVKRVTGTKTSADAQLVAEELMSEFNSLGRAMEIIENSGSYAMRIKPELEAIASDYAAESKFNEGVMKTLALIAFKQPIRQSMVIKYRNNKAYDHVHQLEEEGFIIRIPRGRTFILQTTKKFMEYFGESGLKKKEE